MEIKPTLKKAVIIVWNFFITLSILMFLLSVFSVVKETIDGINLLLSTCGLCFLIIMIVWWRFSDMLTED